MVPSNSYSIPIIQFWYTVKEFQVLQFNTNNFALLAVEYTDYHSA